MKMKAAVCREYNQPLRIEEVELAPPKDHEVLVKTMYTGFCHTDWTAITGGLGFPIPLVIGHEAAGIVQEVGPGVTSVKPGDHVVATWMVACGKCDMCTSGRGHICSTSHAKHPTGGLWDGTSRLTDAKGDRLNHQTFVAGFAEYMVLPEEGAIKMREDFPLDQACFIGCCVPTGFGAVFNVAHVKPGSSVAVWGMGGVGLNVVQSAKLAQARQIIGIDIEGSKQAIAEEFGVTHFIDSSKEDPVPIVQQLTGGGADYCFEVIGDPGAILQAYWGLGIGGTLVMVGIPPADTMTSLPLTFTPPHNKNILGTLYGNVRTHHDLPKLVDMIMEGRYISLDHLITKRFRLEQINDVFDAMTRHEIVGRWVCEYD
jgi:S-(hydroxymethyl)glutathione dehydrogenase/alcohol dehydrogenase